MDTQPSPNSVFLGKNGQIVLEAESSAPTGDWKKVTVQGEASLLWDAPQSSYGKAPSGQTLSYQLATDQAGTYSIIEFVPSGLGANALGANTGAIAQNPLAA
ncbi:MAG: hypothetical protein AAFV72_08110 [Cyanobacteria bacterium J06635_1]